MPEQIPESINAEFLFEQIGPQGAHPFQVFNWAG